MVLLRSTFVLLTHTHNLNIHTTSKRAQPTLRKKLLAPLKMGSERPRQTRLQRHSIRAVRAGTHRKRYILARATYWVRLLHKYTARWARASTRFSFVPSVPKHGPVYRRERRLSGWRNSWRRGTTRASLLRVTRARGIDGAVVAARATRAAVYQVLCTRGHSALIRAALQRPKRVDFIAFRNSSVSLRRTGSSLVRYQLKLHYRQHTCPPSIDASLQRAYAAKPVSHKQKKQHQPAKPRAKRRLYAQLAAPVTYFGSRRQRASAMLNKKRWSLWRRLTTRVSGRQSRARLLQLLGEKPPAKPPVKTSKAGYQQKKTPLEPITRLVQRLKDKQVVWGEQFAEAENLRYNVLQLDSTYRARRHWQKSLVDSTNRPAALRTYLSVRRHLRRRFILRRHRRRINFIARKAWGILRRRYRAQRVGGAVYRWSASAVRLVAIISKISRSSLRARRLTFGLPRRLYLRRASCAQFVSRAQFLRNSVHRYPTGVPTQNRGVILSRHFAGHHLPSAGTAFGQKDLFVAPQPQVLRLSRCVRLARLVAQRRRYKYTPHLSWWVRVRKLKRRQRKLSAKNKRKGRKRLKLLKAFRRSKHRRWYWRPLVKRLRFRIETPKRRTLRRAAENLRNMRFSWWWEARAKRRARQKRREFRRLNPKRKGRSLQRPAALRALSNCYSRRYDTLALRRPIFSRPLRISGFHRVLFYKRRARFFWLASRGCYQRARLRAVRKKRRPLKIPRRRWLCSRLGTVNTSRTLFQARLRSILRAAPTLRQISSELTPKHSKRLGTLAKVSLPWFSADPVAAKLRQRLVNGKPLYKRNLVSTSVVVKRTARHTVLNKSSKANRAHTTQAAVITKAVQGFKPTASKLNTLPVRYPGCPSELKKKVSAPSKVHP